MACAIIPDLDVIGFQFGIRYGDMLGHRGFTHSILFALLMGIFICYFYFKDHRNNKIDFISISWFYFICTVSHGVLDAMTDGGLGVGFFIPFSDERYFFPLRPIPVSPLSIESFFTSFGWSILKAELLFIGFISLFVGISGYYWRKFFMTE
jgi:inner membrane protein